MTTDHPIPTRRVALILQYEGTAYQGLQAQQAGVPTVQGAVERAARQLGSTEVGFVASGRTDAGVHATGQVVALSLPRRLAMEKVPMAMHAMLPEDIRVAAASEVPDDFSPRFDAIRRAYCYRLVVREHPSPLNRRHVARYAHRVEPALLQAAAAAFVGRWELREWRASICQAKRTLLTIERCEAELPTAELPYYRIHVEARSFLHHQVRLMVGGIVAVASEKLSLEELQTALAAGKRPAVVENMPPCGLTMTRVDFPPEKHPFGSLAP